MAEALGNNERKIIHELQKNGRISFVELAKKVGISEVTVRKKVNRLLDEGVLSIVAQANPYDLGFNAPCFIGMDVDREALETVAAQLAELPQVEIVAICNGYDLLVKVSAESTDALYRFIMEDLKRFPAIRDTQTFLVFKFLKHGVCRPVLSQNGSSRGGGG